MSDDPDGKIAAARAEWANKQEALVEEVSQRFLDLAVESFAYFTEKQDRTRINAHVIVDNEFNMALEDIQDRFQNKLTQWIVDNKVHF